MCFSAGASFGASAILVAAGVVAASKAKSTPQRILVAIPFVFAFQQLLEGLLWLSLKHDFPDTTHHFIMYAYLVIAMGIWPMWIPVNMRMFEQDKTRKLILDILIVIGILVSLLTFYVFLSYPVQSITMDHHLHYRFDLPMEIRKNIWVFSIMYCMATIIPPFISSVKKMRWLGIVFAVAYSFTLLFYPGAVVSVWCYFAAILSIVVIYILGFSTRFKKELD